MDDIKAPQSQPPTPAPEPVDGTKLAPAASATAPSDPAIAAPAKPDDAPVPPKTRAPVVAIVVAVLVSGALIGLTAFAYFNNQKAAEQPAPESNAAVTPATADDVDDTTESIDEAINELDDNADFNETDVSDETLTL